MHFCKWLGILLLFACGVTAGLALRAFFRRRCAQAEAFLALLRYVRWQIDCFSTPQEGILANCDRKLLADCGVEKADRPKDFSALLHSVRLFLPEEMTALLSECMGELGGTFRGEQLRCIDYYTARLSPMCEQMRRELPKWEKLALVLPVALSAAVVLLLL